MNIEEIAAICHSVNKQICENMGDFSHKDWDNAPSWQRESMLKAVKDFINNPSVTPAEQHERWLQDKKEKGWTFGLFKNEEAKTHPNLVPYKDLSIEQKLKDIVFVAIVKSTIDFTIATC